ncbi:MAG: helix-turn-helix domain-containing protein [Candidatus Hodarchaeales archaeon]
MTPLTQFEKEYIQCLGDFFELNYLSKSDGMVFGVLVLRALTPEAGLGQNEIAHLVEKSKATVSRALDSLVQNGFCAYNLVETELKSPKVSKSKKLGRAKRRYFFDSEFRKISELKLDEQINGVSAIKTDLERIKGNIPTPEINNHQAFFSSAERLNSTLELWLLAYQKMKETFQNE